MMELFSVGAEASSFAGTVAADLSDFLLAVRIIFFLTFLVLMCSSFLSFTSGSDLSRLLFSRSVQEPLNRINAARHRYATIWFFKGISLF